MTRVIHSKEGGRMPSLYIVGFTLGLMNELLVRWKWTIECSNADHTYSSYSYVRQCLKRYYNPGG